MRTPAAYLRRSASVDPAREQSREMQEASVRRMAQAFEGREPELYVDWGMSGARQDRHDYQRLRGAIEAERVSTVYAYSLSRLGRNARELLDLFELCKARGTTVVTEAEGALAGDTAMGKFLLTIMAAVSELEREQACERSASARAIRRERGDVMGQAPYGFRHVRDASGRIVREPDPETPMAPILDAYREAGTILGTVKLLNARGVPSPKGKLWHQSALVRVIEQNAPDLLPRRGASGKRIGASMALAQLLRCHCGHVMTPNAVRGQYYCSRAVIQPGHGRYNVTEAALLPWVMAEADRLRVPGDAVMAEGAQGRRAALDAKRARILDTYLEGIIDKAERDRRLGQVDAERAGLEAAGDLVELPTIDWQHDPPEAVNGVLRALWRHVQLGPDLRPVAAEWRVPQWRA